MKITDITGPIYEGMWSYGHPFPQFSMKPLPKVEWVEKDVYCEIFIGLHSQTGTYLETPAHFYGNDRTYLLDDVPLSKLYNIPCYILRAVKTPGEDRKITAEMLKKNMIEFDIKGNFAIICSTGWGRHWKEAFYLDQSPYFTYDAMEWLISKKPFLLGTDFPRWDNIQKSENHFDIFYNADILMLAPVVNMENIQLDFVRLTALPIKIPGTSCAPCRALITEGDDFHKDY